MGNLIKHLLQELLGINLCDLKDPCDVRIKGSNAQGDSV